MNKVLFHIRGDAKNKPGGDFSLIKSYAHLMSEAGFDTEIVFSVNPDMTNVLLGFTINLDRPVEPLLFSEHCKKHNVPVFLYSLSHPKEGVDNYLKNGVFGLRRFLAKVSFFDSDRYESIVAIIKCIRNPSVFGLRGLIYSMSRIKSKRRLLHTVNRVLCSGEGEKKYLEKYYSLGGKLDVLPHSFNIPLEARCSKKIWDVVCAGRFESRKNQMLVALLAKRFPDLKFLFIGSVSPTDFKYGEMVYSELAGLGNVDLKEHLSLAELRNCFASSKIFISASWFEVISLTELEAFAAGCNLVVSKFSYISDYVDRGLFQFDPASFNDLVFAFESALRSVRIEGSGEKLIVPERFYLMGDKLVRSKLSNLMGGI